MKRRLARVVEPEFNASYPQVESGLAPEQNARFCRRCRALREGSISLRSRGRRATDRVRGRAGPRHRLRSRARLRHAQQCGAGSRAAHRLAGREFPLPRWRPRAPTPAPLPMRARFRPRRDWRRWTQAPADRARPSRRAHGGCGRARTALIIARVARGLEAGVCADLFELGAAPAEQRAEQGTAAAGHDGHRAHPASPRTPAPRTSRISKVSAWSSR